jgi:hypothetical protein
MPADTLKRIGDTICQDYLGFNPTSNSTKPPHVANGLFRACIGETCDTRDVHEWVISDGRKDAVPSDKIVADYACVLEKGEQEKPSKIKQFRYFLGEIFNQDNTLYPHYDFSVMDISSHWMVKGRLNSEAHIGDFIFEILAKELDGKRSPVISLLQEALSNDSDDLTKLIKPILTAPSDKEKRSIHGIQYPEDSEIHWDNCKERLRNGFDRLANNIIATGENKNSLLVMRRIINFALFSTFIYLTQDNAATYGGTIPPILLDAGSDLESIKKASEQTYTLAKKTVEDFFINSIDVILEEEIPSDTADECQHWIASMVFSSAKREEGIRKAVKSYYDSFLSESRSPRLALSRALQIALYTFEYKNNSPSAFCRVLGVRCGLIGPRGNRASIKRYLINSFTLETVTLSALSRDDLEDGIELKELSEKLISAYNILIGSDAETEYSILETYNIAQSTPGDLRGDLSINSQAIANTYISLGMGKRYADGVTLIGWRL